MCLRLQVGECPRVSKYLSWLALLGTHGPHPALACGQKPLLCWGWPEISWGWAEASDAPGSLHQRALSPPDRGAPWVLGQKLGQGWGMPSALCPSVASPTHRARLPRL